MHSAKYIREYQARRRARFRAGRLCMTCGAKRDGKRNGLLCQVCRKAHVAYIKKRERLNRAKGLCHCGRKTVISRKECTYHSNYRRVHGKVEGKQRKRAFSALKSFDGRCPICERIAIRPCVDHKGRKFRGIICSRCNVGLGCARDSIKVLKAMIRYLKENK